MPILLNNAHYLVEKIGVSPVLRCVLKGSDVTDESMTTANEELSRALDAFDRRRYVILVDVRQGPASDAPGIEIILKRTRRILFFGFAKSAAVVKTAAGRLQAARHCREDGLEPRVFLDDEDAAMAYLTGP